MIFSILIYGNEAITECLPEDEHEAMLDKHRALQQQMTEQDRLAGTVKLMPSSTAVTITGEEPGIVTDGPYAESKEQFVGFYLLECPDLDSAIAAARQLPLNYHKMEIRAAQWCGGKIAE